VRINNSCYVNPLAFVGCTNLSTIYFFGTEEEWNERYPGGSEEIDNAEIIFHEHSWGDWREVEAPGCVTEGRAERYCSECGAKESTPILAIGHRWREYVIDSPASCDAPGSRHRECAGGCIEYETIPPLGHDYGEWEVTLEPTCEKLGKHRGRCAVCGHIKEEDIPTSDHDWGEWYEYKAATCESKGEERRDCSYGHYETRSTEKIDHIPSDWIIDTEATETKKGLRHKECIMCGKILKSEYYEYITPTPTKYFTFNRLEDGTWEMARAKMGAMPTKIFVPSTYIISPVTKIGSSGFFNNIEGWSLETVKLPEGITEIGDYAFSYNWELTNIELPKTLKKLGKVAFQYCVSLKEISLPPSLERIPEYAFAYCSSLRKVEFTGQSIDEMAFYGCKKLDIRLKKTVKKVKRHAFGAAPNTTVYCEATSKPEGWDDEWCDDTINVVWGYTDTETGCTEHSWSLWETTTMPTCMAKGEATRRCEVCEITQTKFVDALSHKWKAPTCTSPQTCILCGTTVGDRDPLAHDWSLPVIIKPATCQEDGLRRKTCKVCGHILEEAIPRLGGEHEFVCVDTPATCTEAGYSTYTCTRCGHSYVSDPVAALGHISSDWIIDKEATGIAEGSKHKECTRCGEILETATIPKVENADEYLTYTLLDSGEGYSVKATNIENLPDELVIPSTYNGKPVLVIDTYAFYTDQTNPSKSAKFSKVTLPDTLEAILRWSFNDCENLVEINIPASVFDIDMEAFCDCPNLTEIHIPIGVEYIGSDTFNGNTNLTIYCEASSQPDTWDENWNSSNCNVVWGAFPTLDNNTYLVTESGEYLTDEQGNLLIL
jgi:hypothetical protein